jgi:cupin 2 domain-containing protein
MIKVENIFKYPNISLADSVEYFEDIFNNDNFRIEKIYSTGQSTPIGQWLEEDVNEFVLLIEGGATLIFKEGFQTIHLNEGDYFIIQKNTEHRVEQTDSDTITTWLTIHFK